MVSSKEKYYKGLFLIAAIYDLTLGIIFTFFYKQAFQLIDMSDKLPVFGGYISLIGAFLFVIGIAYYLIWRGDLQQNRDLIIVGTFYKIAYATVAFVYLILGNIPHPIFAYLFGIVDIIFFILMTECILFLRKVTK
ncbi:MAG: hypothetical protein ISR90_04785 [Candidatus Marinimicrobia bacterium]|nr:hypothetical protein [Candidatus Neomarinimicrobiota bacterium]MBL7023353.1 hypothetical protein [Candidatus Neomarinimicrobiota bacterium]MBL7109312.1 hypothetical protein [Candidatus Neomarinimicrobiota bacterium]